MSTDSDKLDKLTNLIGKTRKDTTGKNQETLALYKAGDLRLTSSIPYGIPTQMAELDLAIGKPGWPVGRIVELYGFEASGKTTLGYHTIAQAQVMGGSALFIDTERTFDPARARQIGVDTDNLRVAEADTVEEIFTYIESVLDGLESVGYDKAFVIVVDSITGVSTEDDTNKDFKAPVRIGNEAVAIRRGMKRITTKVAKQKVLCVFINHAVAKPVTYGKPSQAAGGHALKLWSTIRAEVTSIGQIKDENTKVRMGQKIKITVEKLKGAPLRRPTFETELHNDTGFDKVGSLLNALITIGIVEHAPKSRSYLFVPTKQEFPLVEWPNIIADQGGFAAMYKFFLECAKVNAEITDWSSTDGE